MKITKELRSDIEHLVANIDIFSDIELGRLVRKILERELEKEPRYEKVEKR